MNFKKYANKTTILLLTFILIGSALMIPSLSFKFGQSSAGADFAILEGVAGNDYYDSSQYSYKINEWAYLQNISGYNQTIVNPTNVYFNANKSLRIALDEYGELCTPQLAGIAYGSDSNEWTNTESWSSPLINPKYYIQGWVFYLNYTRQGLMRALEGYALYSDLSTTEGARKVYSWWGQYLPNSTSAVLTGNGTLIPHGVEILYDSARLGIARSAITIHDGFFDEDVAEVFVTVVFNKDTKYAIIYKDVKILLDSKVLDFISDFSFGERYELDIARGINPSNAAFSEYFPNNLTSVYQHPLTGTNNVDIVQAYNPGRNYEFFAAYWPNTTEHTVYAPLIPDLPDGFTRILDVGSHTEDVPHPPNGPGEPSTPWIIAQWRYTSQNYPKLLNWLAKSAYKQIRFVEVAGMTDVNSDPHPVMDLDETSGHNSTNQIDTEVLYMLNQVFKPEDLNSLHPTATNGQNPFMWTGLGQSAATTDSGGAGMVGGNGFGSYATSLTLFDRNDTMFPWTGGIGMKGSLPFGLNSFGGNYYESFSNSGKGTGTDTTTYKRTGLNGFVPGTDEEQETGVIAPPQPIAGGMDNDSDAWYPSKDPLTEAWMAPFSSTNMTGYDNVYYHPNGILSIGGPKANGLTRYFNDFNFAIAREGTSAYALVNGGTVTGAAPTSDPTFGTFDYFPVSTWNVNTTAFNYGAGYAIISLARDINGTRGLSVYGWDGRDTFWATAWASQFILGNATSTWLPSGTVALILKMTYTGPNLEPSAFTVVKALGTITEFGTDDFITAQGSFDLTGAGAWSGAFTVPSIVGSHVWWYQKLPTTTSAKVDFDP